MGLRPPNIFAYLLVIMHHVNVRYFESQQSPRHSLHARARDLTQQPNAITALFLRW